MEARFCQATGLVTSLVRSLLHREGYVLGMPKKLSLELRRRSSVLGYLPWRFYRQLRIRWSADSVLAMSLSCEVLGNVQHALTKMKQVGITDTYCSCHDGAYAVMYSLTVAMSEPAKRFECGMCSSDAVHAEYVDGRCLELRKLWLADDRYQLKGLLEDETGESEALEAKRVGESWTITFFGVA